MFTVIIIQGAALAFKKGDLFTVNFGDRARPDGFVKALSPLGDIGFVPLEYLEALTPHDDTPE